MLGFYIIKLKSSRFDFWLGCCLGLIETLVKILSFGYLSVDWKYRWARYLFRHEKIDHCWLHYRHGDKSRKEK